MSVTVSETRDLLTVRTADVEVAFSRDDAGLRALRRVGGLNFAGHGDPTPSLDVLLGRRGWLTDRTLARYLGHTVEERSGAAEIALTVGLGPLMISDRYRITGTLIARRVTVRNVGEDEVQLHAVRLRIPWLRAGALETGFFEAPGTTVRPRVPLTVAASLRRDVLPRQFFSPALRDGRAMDAAPTIGPGLMAIHDDVSHEALLCWYDGASDLALPQVEGNGIAATLGHEVGLADWLRPEVALTAETQYVLLLNEPWRAALGAFRRTRALTAVDRAAAPAAPAWVRDAAIYECHPAQLGGFAGLAAAIPRLADLGLTTLCLLPVWDYGAPHGRLWDGNRAAGSPYIIRDFARLDPSLGPPEALRAVVDAAHAFGMRVLVDLPLAGCAPEAALVAEQPGWFCHDEGGAPATPGADGVVPFDWAADGLHRFYADWAIGQLRAYDLDGFRAVPPRDSPPNWSRRAAGYAGAGALGYLRLLERLREEARAARPEAAVLGELGGPAFTARLDATLDELPHLMFFHMALGRVQAAELGAWLADHWGALPAGAVRVCFTEAHHTSGLNPIADGLRGSRLSRMLLAGIVLSGFVPLIWCGQEQDEEPFIRALLAARAASPALRRGGLVYNAAECDSRHVFSVLREHEGEQILGLLNVGPYRQTVTIDMPLAAPSSPDAEYAFVDLLGGRLWREEGRSTWRREELSSLRLTLEPFGAYALTLRPAPDEHAPVEATTVDSASER